MTSMLSKIRQIFNQILAPQKPDITAESFAPYPDWPRLLAKDWPQWQAARAEQRGPKILIATGTGGHVPVVTLDSFLAVALTLRGANVHFLLCDELLPACEQSLVTLFPDQAEFAAAGPAKKLCRHCFPPAEQVYRSLWLPVHRYSQFVTAAERQKASRISTDIPLAEIGGFCMDGLAIGEHARAGALRFFARGTLDDEPFGEPVLRRYFQASLLTAMALSHLFDRHHFEAASFHHGIYVPQGLVGEVARQRQVRVANWQVAYRKQCFIFSHGDTYHHTMLTEPTEHWRAIEWTPALEAETLDYLKSRWSGSRDWIWFHEKPEEELAAIAAELGVDFSKPCIGMLTNVMWDAQLHYRANAFPNMLDWAIETIDYFRRRPELQLLIRVHPAEIRGGIPSRQPIEAEIRQAFPELPANVFIISANSPISTYAAMLQCNAVIIYGTKTGVELSSMGIPVIVGGEAWIRNKGLTMDASSPEEYFALLDQLPLQERLDEITVQQARKYAYHFFFRRMIPISFMEPTDGSPPYQVKFARLDDLQPGCDPGTDVICQGIMHGDNFIFPAEHYPGTKQLP